MSSNIRYNLRNRASGPRPGAHSGLAPLPGTFQNPSPLSTDALSDSGLSDTAVSESRSIRSDSRVRPGVSYSQAVRTDDGADPGSLGDQEADPRSSGVDSASHSGLEAYPCTPSPQPSAAVVSSTLSPSDKENTNPVRPYAPRPSSTDVESEPASGLWTKVRRHKRRARSHDGLPLRDLPPHLNPALSGVRLNKEQRRVVNAAEQSLTEEQRSRIQKRMQNIRPGESSESRGEGPSTWEKGKAVDARNWGAADLDSSELDPEAQRRELEHYSIQRRTNEQARTAKKRPRAMVETATDSSGRGQSEAQEDVTPEELELTRQLETAQRKLAELRKARARRALEKGKDVSIVVPTANIHGSIPTSREPELSASARKKTTKRKKTQTKSRRTTDPSQGMAAAFVTDIPAGTRKLHRTDAARAVRRAAVEQFELELFGLFELVEVFVARI
ncbi:hypothetical protein L226DRAFT_607766 [Lentinus tigrinus ALCF2SS1-7]|uniref:uncharacterized protein n=1 Tax=Lentinus tigrinus ALCF2SS1-7 TaxID=1328758 RepID=UPI001165FFB7|nr:hypothetical protein L226DRAFT_607766 [Lentinus tigrinus ALCF2SS1-7]